MFVNLKSLLGKRWCRQGYIKSLDFHHWQKLQITDVHVFLLKGYNFSIEFFILNKDDECFEI